MRIPYGLLRQATIDVGLTEREGEPYTFYYGSTDEMVFFPEPDPDGMIDATFALEDIALWDHRTADRIEQRLEEILRELESG